jgi:hypothetical protein
MINSNDTEIYYFLIIFLIYFNFKLFILILLIIFIIMYLTAVYLSKTNDLDF